MGKLNYCFLAHVLKILTLTNKTDVIYSIFLSVCYCYVVNKCFYFYFLAVNPWNHKFKNPDIENCYFIFVASKLKEILFYNET